MARFGFGDELGDRGLNLVEQVEETSVVKFGGAGEESVVGGGASGGAQCGEVAEFLEECEAAIRDDMPDALGVAESSGGAEF